MPLDKTDWEMIQTESKLLGLKIDYLKENSSLIKDILLQIRNEHIKTNVLLEQLVHNTRHRPMMGPG